MLPLLGLMTIALLMNAMSLAAKLIAHEAHFEASGSMFPCLVIGDLSTGVRGVPGTVCSEKYHEDSQPVEYRFNSNGYRADAPFGPKKLGTYRIVVVGSSFAMGMHVPAEKTFTALLPDSALLVAQRVSVEVFNEGVRTGFAGRVELSLNDALAVKPDMILWLLTMHDVKGASVIVPESVAVQAKSPGAASIGPKSPFSVFRTEFTEHPPLDAMRELWNRTEESFVLLHYLYGSQSLTVYSSLMPGQGSDYLRANNSVDWQSKLTRFATYSASIESKARAAGVPVVSVYFPLRAQAVMISGGKWRKDWSLTNSTMNCARSPPARVELLSTFCRISKPFPTPSRIICRLTVIQPQPDMRFLLSSWPRS